MKENLEARLVGLSTEHRQISYTWRDVALYALSVGAKADDLLYTYEREMKALPTFGVVPYWAAVNVEPRISRPMPAPAFAECIIRPTVAPLHMEHTLELYRPIPALKGTLVYQDVITDVFDRGEGKGAVIQSRVDVHDEAGNLLCTNISNTLFQEGGGFGGKPMPKNPVKIPERNPDFTSDDYISPVQNVLYRLTGDTNLVHVDPEIARERGFDKVFMQGLCSFGFSARLCIRELFPGEPERMTKISAQMRSILYPDTKISLWGWRVGEKQVYFRLMNLETGAAVLDKGVFEWK